MQNNCIIFFPLTQWTKIKLADKCLQNSININLTGLKMPKMTKLSTNPPFDYPPSKFFSEINSYAIFNGLVKTDTFSLKINKISACAVFAFFAPVHYVEFQ